MRDEWLGPGDRLGDYVLERMRGQGMMAVVWSARHRPTGRTCALKVLRRTFMGDVGLAQRFLVEADHLRRLRHPHIVGVLEAGKAGERLYIAMEFAAGWTLREGLAAYHRFPVEHTVELGAQVAEALAYAWQTAGLVHRDIKPENLMIDDRWFVEVLDFGLAWLPYVAGAAGAPPADIAGTLAYMAPEVLAGDSSGDRGADLYALGVCLYEMLVGVRPFHGRDVDEMLALQRAWRPDGLTNLVPGLRLDVAEVIASALQPDPRRRLSDAATLARTLRGMQQADTPSSG
jgi:serine/threonine protein kinase